MIGYLSGIVHAVTEKDLIILTQGVGYKVSCPLPTLLAQAVGKPISLFIHTHVREDALTLFGFERETELELFNRLISVSGIGPKSALAMLSVHSPASVADAVERGDATLLSHTPGIGKKTAEKIVLELKGKLEHMRSAQGGSDALFEVRLALEALGYSAREINEALNKLNPTGKSTSSLVKEALVQLK